MDVITDRFIIDGLLTICELIKEEELPINFAAERSESSLKTIIIIAQKKSTLKRRYYYYAYFNAKCYHNALWYALRQSPFTNQT